MYKYTNLFNRTGVNGSVLIAFLVVEFHAGEHRILESHVYAAHAEHQGVALVRLQWRGYGQPGLSVPVEDVHQLLFLCGACGWMLRLKKVSIHNILCMYFFIKLFYKSIPKYKNLTLKFYHAPLA